MQHCPPQPPLGIDFRPKLVNNFDEQHSFHLSVGGTGKFQGTLELLEGLGIGNEALQVLELALEDRN
jgi:hypothetical protein